MTLRRFAAFAAVALVAVGCDSSDPEPIVEPPPEIRIAGRFDGTTNVNGTAVTLESTLAETNNSVSGSGTLRITNSVAVTATGSHVRPDFNITFRATGLEDLNFAGTSNSDASVLRGRLNGSGFSNVDMTLIKSNPTAAPEDTPSAEASVTEIPEGVTTFRELFELQAAEQ